MPREMSHAEQWAYRAGAKEEARLVTEGMTEEGRHWYDVAHVLAQKGRSPVRMTESLVMIYLIGLPVRERLRISWKLLRGVRL